MYRHHFKVPFYTEQSEYMNLRGERSTERKHRCIWYVYHKVINDRNNSWSLTGLPGNQGGTSKQINPE